MGVKIPAGTENPSLPIYCRALTGTALTGKVAADFTALWYMREGGAKVDVDPAGITEVADGEYRKTFPTAAAAIGANYVTIGGEVSGGVVLGIPIELEVKTGYSLAATGLDAITDPDDLTPATVPTTFSQKLRWLIQRFWRADKTATAITVKNEAGQTITTQAITASGSDQTLGPPS